VQETIEDREELLTWLDKKIASYTKRDYWTSKKDLAYIFGCKESQIAEDGEEKSIIPETVFYNGDIYILK